MNKKQRILSYSFDVSPSVIADELGTTINYVTVVRTQARNPEYYKNYNRDHMRRKRASDPDYRRKEAEAQRIYNREKRGRQ